MSKNNKSNQNQSRGNTPQLQTYDEAPTLTAEQQAELEQAGGVSAAEGQLQLAQTGAEQQLDTQLNPVADAVQSAELPQSDSNGQEPTPAEPAAPEPTPAAPAPTPAPEVAPTQPAPEAIPPRDEAGELAVRKQAISEQQAKDPARLRADALLRPFARYAQEMDKGAHVDAPTVIRNQRTLYQSLKNLLAVDDGQVFALAFKDLLVLWHENSEGAYDETVRLYRRIDNLALSPKENLEFNTLLRLMSSIHDPAKRASNLLGIDLNRALPEIGAADARGYLASYVRRFS